MVTPLGYADFFSWTLDLSFIVFKMLHVTLHVPTMEHTGEYDYFFSLIYFFVLLQYKTNTSYNYNKFT